MLGNSQSTTSDIPYRRLAKDDSAIYEFNSGSLPEKRHPKASARVISDVILGLSDGLTVPFALTAGLSTLGETKVVIYGGLAELIAGAISMGLGGYLAAKSEEYGQEKDCSLLADATSEPHTKQH